MKVRLIGVGDIGESIVLSCVTEFDRLGIGPSGQHSMLESYRVIQLSSKAFQATYGRILGAFQDHLTSPRQEMWLRSALGYLFFGGPITEFDARLEVLSGDRARPVSLVNHSWLSFWFDYLLPLVKKDSLLNQLVREALDEGCTEHDQYMANNAPLGSNWLLLPAMPLDQADLKPRRANIGRKLMKAVLKAGGRSKLIDNLGKNPPGGPDVDMVAIVFSAGDSFGIDGAELLAEEIRTALKHPEATRIIATLGFAVYERNTDEAQDGRCAARYLGLTKIRGQLDGLIIRAKPDASETALADGLGFPQLLASLAMASDPTVIQVDNPDANQLQRDFGRRLFAAGFADAGSVSKIEPIPDAAIPMNLMEMYGQAKQNLLDWHCADRGLGEVWQTLAEQVRGLSGRAANWAQNKPKWLDFVEPLAGGGAPNRRLEFETARKVIAYIGHSGQLNAKELQDLRRNLTQDFPRARTVIYKYSISFSGHPDDVLSASAAATPRASGAPQPAPVSASAIPPNASPAAQPRRTGILERLFGGESAAATPAVPSAAPAAVPSTPQSAPLPAPKATRVGPNVNARPAPIAHFSLFVVDTFQTLAFERLYNFVCNSVDVRPGAKAERWNPQYKHGDIVDLVKALFARSLLSQPFDPSQSDSHKKPWTPPGLAQGVLQTCVRDSVLGGVDEEFQPSMAEAVSAYAIGERLTGESVRTEAEAAADTVEEGATFLIEEAPSSCFTGDELADVLCGLNVICNEQLEPRKVKRTLAACLGPIDVEHADGIGSADDSIPLH